MIRLFSTAGANMRRFFAPVFFAACFFVAGGAAAAGLVTREPVVLFDGPSENAKKVLILGASHPLKEISRQHGWRKVWNYAGDGGWVQAKHLRPIKMAVATAELSAARAMPSEGAAEVFYVRRGVALEVLGERGGWLEVLHPEGETGHMRAADAWVNY